MMVSRLLTYDIMRKLTHGVITKVTQSGRIADTWSGATGNFPLVLNPTPPHPFILDNTHFFTHLHACSFCIDDVLIPF